MGRLGRLGPEQAQRYERARPGELVHIDVKKLGRIEGGAGHRFTARQHYNRGFTDRAGKRRSTVGWEFVHVCVDDASRLAYAEVLPDEKATTAIALPGARDQAPQDARLQAPDQRPGGALHSLDARRVGLRGDLPHELRVERRA